MEIIFKAESPNFIKWLRATVSEVISSSSCKSVNIDNRIYYIDSEYSDPFSLYLLEQLYPVIHIMGHDYTLEDADFDKDTILGRIEIRSLDNERLQLIFDSEVVEIEKINQEIINRITRIWKLEQLSSDDQQGTITNGKKGKKQNAPGKKNISKELQPKFKKLLMEFEKLDEVTQERYIRAIGLIEQLEDKTLEEYRQEDTTKLRVPDQEIVVHLMENMNYAIGERQVRRIKKYRDVILWKESNNL